MYIYVMVFSIFNFNFIIYANSVFKTGNMLDASLDFLFKSFPLASIPWLPSFP
jgi:hypothetical protein